jgi:hypothetical protein
MRLFPPSSWATLLCFILASSISSAAQPKSQRIAFAALMPKMVGDPVFEVQASASSALPVELTSSNPSVAEIVTVAGSATSVRILKSGSTVITAKQPGDAKFAAARAVKRTLTVKARPEGFSHAITFAASDVLSGAYDYEATSSMVAFRAVKRDALFFGSARAANFEPQVADIYVDGVYRGTVDFHKGRLNRPFGLLREEGESGKDWVMLEGTLKSGRVDLSTSLKPIRGWKEVVRAGTFQYYEEDTNLPVFCGADSQNLITPYSYVKGDLFYFSRPVGQWEHPNQVSLVHVNGVLRGFVLWPKQLAGSTIGYRRAGTGPHTKRPEKTAVLRTTVEGIQDLNFDF